MFKLYQKIKLKNSNITGIIIHIKQKNNTRIYTVNIQNKNVIVNEENIEKIDDNGNIKFNNSYTKEYYYNLEKNFINELSIRHQTLDIAMYNVENFINEAIKNNVKDIKIIHGKNGGILRKAVHDYLKHNKHVETFRLGNYYEGSYGVTIIKLK